MKYNLMIEDQPKPLCRTRYDFAAHLLVEAEVLGSTEAVEALRETLPLLSLNSRRKFWTNVYFFESKALCRHGIFADDEVTTYFANSSDFQFLAFVFGGHHLPEKVLWRYFFESSDSPRPRESVSEFNFFCLSENRYLQDPIRDCARSALKTKRARLSSLRRSTLEKLKSWDRRIVRNRE